MFTQGKKEKASNSNTVMLLEFIYLWAQFSWIHGIVYILGNKLQEGLLSVIYSFVLNTTAIAFRKIYIHTDKI